MPLTYAYTERPVEQEGEGLLTTLPTWNDERLAYLAQGLTIDAGLFEHIEGGNYSTNNLEDFALDDFTGPQVKNLWTIQYINSSTESDDLWTAYHMVQRLAGIKPTARWEQRYAKLKHYFINDYLSVINPAGESTDANHEHIYGWGLAEAVRDGVITGSEATDAITAIDAQVTYLTSWANSWVGSPGSVIAGNGPYGRRWARMLRFAVAAHEASPTTANKTWRDRVIDTILQDPNVDETYNVTFFNESFTNSSPGGLFDSLTYADGDRAINTFHAGTWLDALWQAWRVLDAESDGRAATVRQRLIDLATLYRDFGPEPSGGDQGKIPRFLFFNVTSGTRVGGDGNYGTAQGATGIYTISPTNGLVMAYKFTGTQSYLDAAWTNYKRWLELRAGASNTVDHYIDSELDPTERLLGNNKGELQYVYALFENGGSPQILSGSFASWAPAVGQWKSLADVSGVNTLDDVAEYPYNIEGTDDPNSKMRHWCGAATDEGYMYIGAEGGHDGGYDNAVFRVGPFNTEAGPRWQRLENRTPDAGVVTYQSNGNSPYYLDGKPTSRHGRDLSTIVYGIAGFADRLFHCGAHDPYDGSGWLNFQVDAFRIDDGEWDAAETYGLMPNVGGTADRAEAVVYDPVCKRIIRMVSGGSGASGIQPYNPVTDTWGSVATGTPGFGIYGRVVIAPEKRLVFGIGGSGSVAFVALLNSSGVMIDSLNLGTIAQWAGNGGSCYCPILGTHGAFLLWNGGQRIDKIEIPSNYLSSATTLNTGASWSSVNMGMGGATPSAQQARGTFGRFCWIKDSNLVYVVNNVTEPGWVARVA